MAEVATSRIADAPPNNWVDRWAPAATRPFLRLARADRPIGTWLLLLPGWWSVAMAAAPGQWPDWRVMALFGVGAWLMRGAGCTFNDIVDRDVDARVERTRRRPLPAGEVGLGAAVAWMLALSLLGLLVLLQFNGFAIAVGAASLLLVAIYPFMKRVTWWPQFFLGLAFNWGALLGWAAVRGTIDWPAAIMYAAGVSWTLGYDTIYAHQDKEDDALIGVKSTARRLARDTRAWLALFYALLLAGLVWAGWLAGLQPLYFAGLAVAALHLAWQIVTLREDDPADCLAKFRANKWLGLMVLASIVAGQVA